MRQRVRMPPDGNNAGWSVAMAEGQNIAGQPAGIAGPAMRFVPFVAVSAIALLAGLRLLGIVFTQVPRWYAHGIVVTYVVVTPLVVGDIIWAKRLGRPREKTLLGRVADILDFLPWG